MIAGDDYDTIVERAQKAWGEHGWFMCPECRANGGESLDTVRFDSVKGYEGGWFCDVCKDWWTDSEVAWMRRQAAERQEAERIRRLPAAVIAAETTLRQVTMLAHEGKRAAIAKLPALRARVALARALAAIHHPRFRE